MLTPNTSAHHLLFPTSLPYCPGKVFCHLVSHYQLYNLMSVGDKSGKEKH